MGKAIDEYFEALKRLKQNKPINVPIGTAISNDTVAMEAGRQRGTIKKSRPAFSELIQAINQAIESSERNLKKKVKSTKQEVNEYKTLYEEALSRELMYLERINELEKQLKRSHPLAANNI